jgi:hypothetical protein
VQVFDDVPIMYDFFSNVDGCAKKVESDLYHVNGANHARAKAARTQEQNLLAAAAVFGCRPRFWHRNSHYTNMLAENAYVVTHLLYG